MEKLQLSQADLVHIFLQKVELFASESQREGTKTAYVGKCHLNEGYFRAEDEEGMRNMPEDVEFEVLDMSRAVFIYFTSSLGKDHAVFTKTAGKWDSHSRGALRIMRDIMVYGRGM